MTPYVEFFVFNGSLHFRNPSVKQKKTFAEASRKVKNSIVAFKSKKNVKFDSSDKHGESSGKKTESSDKKRKFIAPKPSAKKTMVTKSSTKKSSAKVSSAKVSGAKAASAREYSAVKSSHKSKEK